MNSSLLDSSEYNSYYAPYVSGLGEVDLLACLNKDSHSFVEFINQIPDDKLTYSYKEGKWSIAEILVHLLDAERVFQYRALRFARNDSTQIPGFDQDLYVPNSRAKQRTKESIVKEFMAVRSATIALFSSFNDDELRRLGSAGGNMMSVRALGFVICGHLKHHRHIIKERYLYY